VGGPQALRICPRTDERTLGSKFVASRLGRFIFFGYFAAANGPATTKSRCLKQFYLSSPQRTARMPQFRASGHEYGTEWNPFSDTSKRVRIWRVGLQVD